MGTGVEMKRNLPALVGALLSAALLSACGSAPDVSDTTVAAEATRNLFTSGFGLARKPASTAPTGARLQAIQTALAQSAVPVYGVKVDKLRFNGFVAPYGINGSIRTWASTAYQTVSMNDGVLVATRGFGSDMMSAVAPSIGQISSGNGFFHRVYYYLDGADQPQRLDFDCNFSTAGSETIDLYGQGYVARRVNESCANPDTRFENAYWFDGSGKLRQSDQFVSVQVATMRLQRLVD